jgi:tRNA U34 5-carboxymethylaminomethyl modifying enzyme MnmG/GidA
MKDTKMKKEYESVKEVMQALIDPCGKCVHENEKASGPNCCPCLERRVNNFKEKGPGKKIKHKP